LFSGFNLLNYSHESRFCDSRFSPRHAFAPFDIRLSDGRAWRITHPDFVMITGRGRVIIEGETNDVYANVSRMHITSVERVRASA
jgi:hypothetical protein